jgi:hypothetical protein
MFYKIRLLIFKWRLKREVRKLEKRITKELGRPFSVTYSVKESADKKGVILNIPQQSPIAGCSCVTCSAIHPSKPTVH